MASFKNSIQKQKLGVFSKYHLITTLFNHFMNMAITQYSASRNETIALQTEKNGKET